MITNSTLKSGSEVSVNGFKNTMHMLFLAYFGVV